MFTSFLLPSLEFKVFIASVLSDKVEALGIFDGPNLARLPIVAGQVYNHIFAPRAQACLDSVERCGSLRAMLGRSRLATAMILKFGVRERETHGDFDVNVLRANDLFSRISGSTIALGGTTLLALGHAPLQTIYEALLVPEGSTEHPISHATLHRTW